MGLINFFSIKFFFNNFSTFSWSKTFKSLFLKAYNLVFLEIAMPFATAKETLTPE